MSYCRWSSDDWTCDVYCYESYNGFETHVARSKPVGVPKNTAKFSDNDLWFDQHKKQIKFLQTAEYKDLNLPYDGKDFIDTDMVSFLKTLVMLKKAGYNVPDYVISGIQQEIAEDSN